MKKQSGFTLIELIVVIVILGILAAIALPQFVDLGSDARTSVVKALGGSMRDTNTMIYSKTAAALSAGTITGWGTTGTPVSVTINGTSVNVAYGFAATVTDLKSMMDLSSELIISGSFIEHTGASTVGATCAVTYTAATASVPPTYTVTTTGC